jgi:hypothetical protein
VEDRNKVYLQDLLDDWDKLTENKFFDAFLASLRNEALQALKRCGQESYAEQKIRYYQGVWESLRQAGSREEDGLLARFLKEIRDKLT